RTCPAGSTSSPSMPRRCEPRLRRALRKGSPPTTPREADGTGVPFQSIFSWKTKRMESFVRLHESIDESRPLFLVQVNPYQETHVVQSTPGGDCMVVFAEYIWMDGTQPTQKL